MHFEIEGPQSGLHPRTCPGLSKLSQPIALQAVPARGGMGNCAGKRGRGRVGWKAMEAKMDSCPIAARCPVPPMAETANSPSTGRRMHDGDARRDGGTRCG
jgi:hypothetical protein